MENKVIKHTSEKDVPIYLFFFLTFSYFSFLFFFSFFFFQGDFFLNFIFKLYNIVLVLPYIEMHPPQAYTCSPS